MRIGIDLGGTKIEGIALADDGRIVARHRIPTPRDDYESTVDAVADLVRRLEKETGTTGPVGIGHPGAISPATGLIKNANNTCLIGHRLDRDLADRIGPRVRLANDANCFAISEAIDGAASGRPTVFGVILGTGCGGGLVVEGRVLTGANAVAGEWGHNPLPAPRDDERPGAPCYCGHHGCIETWLSGPGMAQDHARRHGGKLGSREIVDRAAAGDPACVETLELYVDRLARALGSVINLFDPHAIVLGGGLSNIDLLYERVPQIWGAYIFSDRVDTPLLRPAHGDSSGVRGAAWLWRPGEYKPSPA